MKIPVESVRVGERIRKELGDIEPLVKSLQTHGQFSPILVTADNELIAGQRRLESAKQLGWETIEAIRIDVRKEHERLALELAENTTREQLNSDEVRAANSRIRGLLHPTFGQRLSRLLNAIMRSIGLGRRPKPQASAPATE